MRFLGFILIAFLLSEQGHAQSEADMQKYWLYRERLKNFVVPGDCDGCSLISNQRSWETIPPNPYGPNYALDYGDQTQELGHYIGMLATEYAMIHGSNSNVSPTFAQKNVKELFYALDAFNRLDLNCERYWRFGYLNQPLSAAQSGDLNGAFMREDVPLGFTYNSYTDETGTDLIKNRLTDCYAPVSDAFKVNVTKTDFAPCSGCAFIETGHYFLGTCSNENGKSRGPVDASLDQVCQMMAGLALVVKLVPVGQTFADQNGVHSFLDSYTDISNEAKAIENRIFSWISSNNWDLQNQVTNRPDAAVCWGTSPTNGLDFCKVSQGGGGMRILSSILAQAHFAIQDNFNTTQTLIDYNNFAHARPFDFDLIASQTLFSQPINFIPQVNAQLDENPFHICTLITIGNYYGNNTDSYLVANSQFPKDNHHSLLGRQCLFTPLMHQVLYPSFPTIMPSTYYTCILDRAPCLGPDGFDGNNNFWGGGATDVLVYGANNSPGVVNSFYNGISYMWLYNMLTLVDPGILPSEGFSELSPFQIAPPYVNLSQMDALALAINPNNGDLIVDEHRNHIASNIITAGNSPVYSYKYIIQNASNGYPAQAIVNLQCGNLIQLNPGFEAHYGSEFTAQINPNIQTMQCGCASNPYCTADGTNNCTSFLPSIVVYRSYIDTTQSLSDRYNEILSALSNRNTVLQKDSLLGFSQIKLLPNPSTGKFQINVSSDLSASIKKVVVYDLLGKEIFNSEIITDSNYTIDIGDQPNGIYLIHIIDSNGNTSIRKIIKQD